MRLAIVCCMLICVNIQTGYTDGIPNYNLSIFNVQDGTCDSYAKIHLDHAREQQLKLFTNHSCDDTLCSDTILIVFKKTAGPKCEQFPACLDNRTENSTVPSILPGYTQVPRFGQYKVYTEVVSWSTAKTNCEADGTHLLILNSEAEANEVKKLLKISNTENNWHWVGIHDHNAEGAYATIFGQTLASTGYAKWYRNHPYSRDDWDCVCFKYDNEHGLGDWGCDVKIPFICELEISN